MKTWKHLIPGLFALAAVMFAVPTVISVIKGEPLNYAFLALSPSFFTLAVVFFIAGRKSAVGSRPPGG